MEEKDTNQEKISNLKYFSDMVGGNKVVLLDVINTFLEQTKEEWNLLDNAVELHDFEQISKIAHLMKSTVSVMGAKVITHLLEELQNSSKLGVDIEQIKTILIQLRNYYEKCTNEIKAERENYV